MLKASSKEIQNAEIGEEGAHHAPVCLHAPSQQHLDSGGSQAQGDGLLPAPGQDGGSGSPKEHSTLSPAALKGLGLVVTRENFEECLSHWMGLSKIALDTETTGLRPYHGDRLFSIILADDNQAYYLNFQAYPGLDTQSVLTDQHLRQMGALWARPDATWFLHNAKFDLHILWQEGIELAGSVHCTQAIARVEYNDHMSYSLDACAERIGFRKDDAVEKYIQEHKLIEKRAAANQDYTHKFFDRVPFEIIVPYGLRDAQITRRLAHSQEEACERISRETPEGLPSLRNIVENEKRLTHTIFRMERTGLRVDLGYCVRASRFEAERAEAAAQEFKRLTGRDFKVSPKLFAEVFQSDRERWGTTEKGNPSFDSDSLASFENPAAKAILEYRDAKSKSDFYRGFLYHADRSGDVHPSFNPHGTATGRFSSADPNFQNLTSSEGEEDQEFIVRRAIIPRPGFVLFSIDYSSMEYRMAFDYACSMAGRLTELARQVLEGKDPHQATADLVTALGTPLTRKRAKNGNFALLYGSGDRTLASTIGGSVAEARALRASIFTVAPEIKALIDSVMRTSEVRGFIRNWAGRRLYCKDPRFSYKMLNWLIQGGTADVNKFALNKLDEFLMGRKTRMIATIHDEAVFEVSQDELGLVPELKRIMEYIYPAKYLPLLCSVDWSERSLGDLKPYEAH
jgi:DNA polymerase-1